MVSFESFHRAAADGLFLVLVLDGLSRTFLFRPHVPLVAGCCLCCCLDCLAADFVALGPIQRAENPPRLPEPTYIPKLGCFDCVEEIEPCIVFRETLSLEGDRRSYIFHHADDHELQDAGNVAAWHQLRGT